MEVTGPGIYFGLDERTYHAAPYLGSTAIKQLYSSPPDYWWGSHMNPVREVEEESHALKFGTALHHRILYGEASFKKHYVPVDGGTKTGEVSADALVKWLKDNGGNPRKLKSENEKAVFEDFGVTLVSQKVYDRLLLSAQMIVKNPNLTEAFTSGWPEVSIFWMDDGVPCKGRLDWLKVNAIVDLKSFSDKNRIDTIDKMILRDMFNLRYDMQAAHYIRGHSFCADLVKAGKVFAQPGTLIPDDVWLKKAFARPPGWVFVFYKSTGAPLSKSFQVRPDDTAAHKSGNWSVKLALDNYRDNMAKFGTDPWVNLDPPFSIDDEDVPKWLA